MGIAGGGIAAQPLERLVSPALEASGGVLDGLEDDDGRQAPLGRTLTGGGWRFGTWAGVVGHWRPVVQGCMALLGRASARPCIQVIGIPRPPAFSQKDGV